MPPRLAFCERFGQLNQFAANVRLFNLRKGAVELKPLCGAQKVHQCGLAGAFPKTRLGAFIWRVGNVIEKEGDRNTEYPRHLPKPAGADSVGPFLVFLNLLECQTQLFTEFLLAEANENSPHADPSPNMHIYRIWSFFNHNRSLRPNSPRSVSC